MLSLFVIASETKQSLRKILKHIRCTQCKQVQNDKIIFFLLLSFLPTQFGRHFWPTFAFVSGQRIDYLSPTLYLTDILVDILFVVTLLQRKIRVHPLFLFTLAVLSASIISSAQPMAGWYFLVRFVEMSFVGWYTASRVNEIRISNLKLQIPNFKFGWQPLIIRNCKLEIANWKLLSLAFSLGIIFESLLVIAQFVRQSSIGGIFYFFGERTFTGSTPGIANASLHGQLVLRPYGTFSHPNVLAGYLLIGMLLLLYFVLTGSRVNELKTHQPVSSRGRPASGWNTLTRNALIHNMGIGLVFLLGTIALFLTLSRIAILLWIVCGAVLLFFSFKQATNKKFFVVCFLLFVFCCLFLAPLLLSRFSSLSLTDESVTLRETLMSASFNMISAHPLFGVGPNNFLSSLPHYTSSFVIQPVHNIFLLWIAETGIVGGLIAGVFVCVLFTRLINRWKNADNQEKKRLLPLLLAVCSVLVIGMFDHYFLTLQQGQLLVALVVGLSFS